MDPANLANVGAAVPSASKPHGQMPAQNIDNLMCHVAQMLHSQGPFSGWRAEVPVNERAKKICQMITSLHLMQPLTDLQTAARAALGFEKIAFTQSHQKADYESQCNEKLGQIRDNRVRQAAMMQNGMMPQGGAGAGMGSLGQNQMSPSFSQQMSHPVQPSSIPNQQPMAMNFNDSNQQAAIQQQRQQQQQQRHQQRPAAVVPFPDDLNSLSPQEYEHVCRLANQMLTKTPSEDIEKIKLNLANMTPENRQYLAKKGIEPITYFFRQQALNSLRRLTNRNRLEIARQQNLGVDPSGGMMSDPTMNAQQRQIFHNTVNLQYNPGFAAGGQQSIDPSAFVGNVESIQGQQADGLRSQEAGQLVVPASSINQHQFATSPGMIPVGAQVGQSGQVNITSQFLAPQHAQGAQNGQQDRAQQAAQFQAQIQAQARAQAAQKTQLPMSSQAGPPTNSQMSQQPSQQNSSMPVLNQPMPGQMSPGQTPAQVRPPSRAPGMPGGVQSLPGQPTMQTRPVFPPGALPAMQEQFAHMTPEQINAFLVNQRRAQAMARANATQQNAPLQHAMAQLGQTQQFANGQLGNTQNMRAALNMQQQLAALSVVQQQNQMGQGQQQLSLQQRQQQLQQSQLYKLQLLRQQNGSTEMTPEQINEMDRLPFPQSMFTNYPHPVPKNIKTWGQLKQWVASNQQVPGGTEIAKLLTFQKLHYAQLLSQGKDLGRNMGQTGQNHGVHVPTFSGQQSSTNPQNVQPGQHQAFMNMDALKPITNAEIEVTRQRFGAHVQHYTDDQLREILQKNRRKQIMLQAQSRAAQGAAGQNLNYAQPAPQPTPTAMSQIAQQINKQPIQQQSTQSSQPSQGAKSQAAASGKATKTSTAKQGSKKKANIDEPAEMQNAPSQPGSQAVPPQQAAPVLALAKTTPSMTQEQLVVTSPQQRAQMEAHVRKQQGHGPQQRSLNRSAAEDAWNQLPDRIKQLYTEIANNIPVGEPLNLSPEQKAAMTKQLRECTDMLSRMDALVQWFAKIPNQEKNIRSLLAMRVQLINQFKPGTEWIVKDQLTVQPDYLAVSINNVKQLFLRISSRVNQQQNPTGQRPNVSVPPSTQQSSPAALNAANLQQLQQQEDARQRARGASSQTAATLPQPPFGAPSPQGVPHAYGPGGFPPEKLKLPPSKKRKQSHGGSGSLGPAPTAAPAAKSQLAKQPATEAKSVGTTLAGPYKCNMKECHYQYQGFATQAALDKHLEDTHKTEEPIENALEFALGTFETSLIKKRQKASEGIKKRTAIAMESHRSSQIPGAATTPVKHDVKVESATPATGRTTPMVRISSQVGPKSASPISQLTPGPLSDKLLTSTVPKPMLNREGKKVSDQAVEPVSIAGEPSIRDPWAESAISLDSIHDTFADFGDEVLPGLGLDAIEDFLIFESFTKASAEDTPDSADSNVATQTPKDEEHSKDVDVRIGDAFEENWIPSDWISLPESSASDLLRSDFGNTSMIDWDSIELKEKELSVDNRGIPIYVT